MWIFKSCFLELVLTDFRFFFIKRFVLTRSIILKNNVSLENWCFYMIFTFFNFFWYFWKFVVDLLSGFHPSYNVCSVTGFFRRILWDVLFPEMNSNLTLTVWTSRYINDFTLILQICRIGSPGAFPLQPYYSRVENVKFYSTSH